MNNQQTAEYYRDSASARMSALLIVCIGSFLTPLSLSATMVAIPAIARDLQADAVFVSWIPSVFLLANLIALLPTGRLADTYGRKRMYLGGSLIFVVGSVLSGVATNIEMLLLFRVIQGIGAAMIFSTGMAIVSSVYKEVGRGAALGWVVGVVYLGLTAGPLIGGWLTEHYGWQSVFLFQAPLGLLGIVLGLIKMKGEWRSDRPQPLDLIGSALLAIWVMALFFGVTRLPDLEGWGLLLISILFMGIFVYHCDRAEHPLVRLRVVWENRVYSRSLLASMFMWGGNYGLVFLLGLYLQYTRGMTPTDAGKMLMYQAVVMAVLAPMTGKLSDRFSPKLLATLGCLIVAVTLSFMLFMDNSTSITVMALGMMALGLGFGLFSTPNSSAALGAVPEEKMGIASALLNLARLKGQLLGTASVTLLLALLIGKIEITPDHYEAVGTALRSIIFISLIFALLATYFSFAKGSPKTA